MHTLEFLLLYSEEEQSTNSQLFKWEMIDMIAPMFRT